MLSAITQKNTAFIRILKGEIVLAIYLSHEKSCKSDNWF